MIICIVVSSAVVGQLSERLGFHIIHTQNGKIGYERTCPALVSGAQPPDEGLPHTPPPATGHKKI